MLGSPHEADDAGLVVVDDLPGAVVPVGDRPIAVFDFTLREGQILAVDLLADPETLATLSLQPVRRREALLSEPET